MLTKGCTVIQMELLSDVAMMAIMLMTMMMVMMMMLMDMIFMLTQMEMVLVLIIIMLMIIIFFKMRKEIPQVCVLQFNSSLILVDFLNCL